MASLGAMIKQLREKRSWPQRKLAHELDIDVAVLSKIENDNKLPNKRVKEIIATISNLFDIPEEDLKRIYFSDKIASLLLDEDDYEGILEISGGKIMDERKKRQLLNN